MALPLRLWSQHYSLLPPIPGFPALDSRRRRRQWSLTLFAAFLVMQQAEQGAKQRYFS